MSTSDTPAHRAPDVSALRPRSQLVHGGVRRSSFDETSEAMFLTSGFVYGAAEEAEEAFRTDGLRHVYSRFRNPTSAMFEDRLAAYEGAAWAYATTTGMAAVFAALMCHLKAGDRIVAPWGLFGSCLHILKAIAPRYGVRPVLVDGPDLDQWRAAICPIHPAVIRSTYSSTGNRSTSSCACATPQTHRLINAHNFNVLVILIVSVRIDGESPYHLACSLKDTLTQTIPEDSRLDRKSVV